MVFNWKRRSPNLALTRLLDQLTDEQVSVLITGDCWNNSYVCACRSVERLALYRLGIADVLGRLSDLGLQAQQELFGD